MKTEEFNHFLKELSDTYARGENMTKYFLKKRIDEKYKELLINISYDLQAGEYTKFENISPNILYDSYLIKLLGPLFKESSSLLHLGVGEATTLSLLLKNFEKNFDYVLGLDISWSRLSFARKNIKKFNCENKLFVASMSKIPLQDNSVDIVFTHHSIEPNGGAELELMMEGFRVCRKVLVLVEPFYEVANESQQNRMSSLGYARDLEKIATEICEDVEVERLLYSKNPENPSGLFILRKSPLEESVSTLGDPKIKWRCPISGHALTDFGSYFFNQQNGLAYPVLDGIPVLSANNVILASALKA